MRRYAPIVLGAVVLVWGVLAITLGSATLGIAGSGGPGRSPSCRLTGGEPSAALAAGLAVSPAPGSGTANPATQISFMGLPAAEISSVSVTGAHSGAHSGTLHAYSQGDGASFVPSKPFAPGEQVRVSALVGSGSARHVSFGFRVDTPFPTASVKEFPAPPAAPADYQSFYSRPELRPPVLSVTTADRDPAAGYVFTTNGPGPGQYGPLIYAPDGHLVWFDHLTGGSTAENLNVQSYEGHPALTWWKGRVLSLGFGQGEDLVMDGSYRTIARVAGGNGLPADLHDFQLAPRGVAYATAFNPIRCDLRSVGGSSEGSIVDTAVQAIDIKTGLVRWEWHSLDHIGAAESEVEASHDATPWDYFHLNSIELAADGNVLLSARSTWAVYELQRASGRVLWRLGGNRSSFQMGPGTKMAWQHDARLLSNGEVSVFDDGSNPPIHKQSRALRIKLDTHTRRATLTAAYTHKDPPLLAASQGNAQPLPDGNTLVGYGGVPAISEYARDGSLLFDAHQPYDTAFYRAFRHPWTARPSTPPAVLAAFNNTEEETVVHTSWDGATGVAAWRVLAGAKPGSLQPRATIPSSGFETETTLPVKYSYVAVEALDAAGRRLGASQPVKTIGYYAALWIAGAPR
ncbi:MAG TPA: arylsulfotransferase family protein [Solirubrobacteraceae bacterium]